MVEDFEGWYRHGRPRVLAVLRAACGDVDVATDATDGAFVRALDHWGRVRAMDSPDAWVTKVAVNVMRRRARRHLKEAALLGSGGVPDGSSVRSAPDPDPELWAAVRQLPERQRLAVVLRYVGDLTEGDIASVMGIARGTVAASLSKARAQLAAVLEDPTTHTDSAAIPKEPTHD